jgi:hypothetical protein
MVHRPTARSPKLDHRRVRDSASPTYVSLVQNNYTEHFGGDATYPDQDYIGPMYVVNNVEPRFRRSDRLARDGRVRCGRRFWC